MCSEKCPHYSIDCQFLEEDNQEKKKNPLAWLSYSDSSFNPASYNSVSNIYSVPPVYQIKCLIFINLLIPHDAYEACVIFSPILLMSKLRLTKVTHFARGHMSKDYPPQHAVAPLLSPL